MTNLTWRTATLAVALLAAGGYALAQQHANRASAAAFTPVADPHTLQVVELFQSQGCSSCPPANANVMAIADRPGVLTLSWQVTYWDNLGWRDSFGSPAFTDRQHAYARALGHNNVWTPQVVINGRGDVVGVDSNELNGALQRYARAHDSVNLSTANGHVVVTGPSGQNDSVVLVRYDPRVIPVPVGAGENSGRTLPHRNVVRALVPLGQFNGGRVELALPAHRADGLQQAILVQQGAAGPILAAQRL